MKEYHKIHSVFKRDQNDKKKLIIGHWTTPELDYLKDNIWIFTEKVDGTNIRVKWNHLLKKVTFEGKTSESQIPSKLVSNLIDIFPSTPFEKLFPESSVCLYGEGYGGNIQDGKNYRKDQSFVLFDVNINDWWLKRNDVEEVSKILGIEVVPIIGEGTLNQAIEMTEKGFYSKWGNFIAEGIVMRPKVDLRDRGGERIITKIKYKDFKR